MTAAGILPGQAVIEGMQDCQAFAQAFLRSKADQTPRLDRDAIEAAAVAKALALQLARQDLGALLLECGNLPPYAAAIGRATGLPVYSILDAARLIIGAATRPN